ncbi:hypothetical protein [Paraburkholderia diazotrophica]|uniref:Uncharacterized protein n=1 Tax=Paraburkholderia diazotrophica TaxID=667676 RepID=A0A1H7CNH0_9BURK|nr:hypothetical protein [Paraburkholderia diazotrophica]SEJ87315.1 hypothetical protein SAMN05192539_102173 [Paraburkholderia diazotrophica]
MKDEKEVTFSEASGLVGRFFHVMHGRRIRYQGRVVAQIDATRYLCQFYEFLLGQPNTLHVFNLDDMVWKDGEGAASFQFYDDAEHWRNWFEHCRERDASATAGEPS